GLFYEMINTGSVSEPLLEFGLPAAIIATASQLPLGTLVVTAFLLITVTFVVTTADSMSYSLSMAVTGEGNLPKILRVFWAIIMLPSLWGAPQIAKILAIEQGITKKNN